MGWKIGAITAGIKKYKPMIKEKEEEIEEENSKTKKEESSPNVYGGPSRPRSICEKFLFLKLISSSHSI